MMVGQTDRFPDVDTDSLGGGCQPIGNSEGEGGGSVTLRTGTVKSINTVFAQLIEQVGVKPTAEMAKKLGITSAWYSPQVHGLSYTLGVIDVSPGGPADKAGVRSGEVITYLDGKAVDDSDTLGAAIDQHGPGDTVQMTVVQPSGASRTVSVTLGARPLPTTQSCT